MLLLHVSRTFGVFSLTQLKSLTGFVFVPNLVFVAIFSDAILPF